MQNWRFLSNYSVGIVVNHWMISSKRLQTQLVLKADTVLSQALQRQPRNARISYNGAMLMAYPGCYELSSKLLRTILVSSPQRTVIWNHAAANKAYAQQHTLNENWGKK